jgi:NTP pyrophosphatase (non-canonical NTP hydrolase)
MSSSHDEELELGRKVYARVNGLDTLDRVQTESGMWRANAYPDSVNDTLAQLAGVTEEVGELAHALLKHHQGIRGYDIERTRAEAGDAIADAIIYMCGVADSLGLNVADELSKAWAHVKSRNLVQNSDPGPSSISGEGVDDANVREHTEATRSSLAHISVNPSEAEYRAKLKATPIEYPAKNFIHTCTLELASDDKHHEDRKLDGDS